MCQETFCVGLTSTKNNFRAVLFPDAHGRPRQYEIVFIDLATRGVTLDPVWHFVFSDACGPFLPCFAPSCLAAFVQTSDPLELAVGPQKECACTFPLCGDFKETHDSS